MANLVITFLFLFRLLCFTLFVKTSSKENPLIIRCYIKSKTSVCVTSGFMEKSNHQTLIEVRGEVRTRNDRNICERRSCMKNMVKVPLSNSFLERRDDRRKFSESLGLAPPWRHALVSGSHLDPKMTGSGAVRAGKRRN